MICPSSPCQEQHLGLWRFVEIIALSLCGQPGPSSPPAELAPPHTIEEVNNVRIYKSIAKSTVLIASAYHSPHHVTQASWKGLGAGGET
jgi:predicted metallo-beta-lactamase superfamily hydrolase